MNHILKLNEAFGDTEITFTNKRNASLTLTVVKSRDGRIINIINPRNVSFPFKIGQILQRNIESWASNNNYLMDGKDLSPEEKVFGIKVSDIPQNHEFRKLYPNKFRK